MVVKERTGRGRRSPRKTGDCDPLGDQQTRGRGRGGLGFPYATDFVQGGLCRLASPQRQGTPGFHGLRTSTKLRREGDLGACPASPSDPFRVTDEGTEAGRGPALFLSTPSVQPTPPPTPSSPLCPHRGAGRASSLCRTCRWSDDRAPITGWRRKTFTFLVYGDDVARPPFLTFFFALNALLMPGVGQQSWHHAVKLLDKNLNLPPTSRLTFCLSHR